MGKWKLLGKKKTKVFGVSLKDRMEYEEANLNNYQQVPQIVSNLINLIGEMEPVEGVFRVNGSGKNIHELASALDQQKKVNLAKQPIFDLASLLKKYFRDLPEPLLMFKNYDDLARIGGIENEETRVQQLSTLIRSFPPVHKATAKKLFYLLHHIAGIPEYRMDESNLSIVWCPNLIRPEKDQTDITSFLSTASSSLARSITTMITNYNDLFGSVTTPAVSPAKKSLMEIGRSASASSVLQTSAEKKREARDEEFDDEEDDVEVEKIDDNDELYGLEFDIDNIIEMETRRLTNSRSPLRINPPARKSRSNAFLAAEDFEPPAPPVNQMLHDIINEYEEQEEQEEEEEEQVQRENVTRDKRRPEPNILKGKKQEGTIEDEPDPEILLCRGELSELRRDLATFGMSLSDISERVLHMEYVQSDLVKKLDHLIQEYKYGQVKAELEIEGLKRQVDGHTNKIRSQNHELETLKSKVETIHKATVTQRKTKATSPYTDLLMETPPATATVTIKSSSSTADQHRTSAHPSHLYSTTTDPYHYSTSIFNNTAKRLATTDLSYNNTVSSNLLSRSTQSPLYKSSKNNPASNVLESRERRQRLIKAGMYNSLNLDHLKSRYQ